MLINEVPLPEGYKELKCPKCGHVWFSHSKHFWVTCPNCVRKFNADPKARKRKRGRPKTKQKIFIETVSKKIERFDNKRVSKKIKPKYVLKVDG